jgi:peroxiredoxin
MRMVPWRLLGAGMAFGLALGIGAFFGFPMGSSGADSGSVAEGPAGLPAEQAPAPDFTLERLDGSQVSLSDFRDHVVLVNFWATWCAPCRIEMPSLQDRYDRFQGQGFVVLAVNDEEPAGVVQAYVDELGLTFPTLLDPDGAVQQLYAVRGYPSSYLIDGDGTIRMVQIGLLSEDQLDRSLAELGLSS